MDSWWVLAVIAMNVAIGGYAAIRELRPRARLLLRRTRRVPIRDAPDGFVRLEGRVLCDAAPLTAPVSGRACVFYDMLVDTVWLRGSRTVVREVRGLAFTVEDESGAADVLFADAGPTPPLQAGPRGVHCLIPRPFAVRGGRFVSGTAAIDDWLARNGDSRDRLYGREGTICVGDRVSVLGRGTREIAAAGDAAGYRAPPTRYVLRASEDVPLTVVKMPA